MNETVLEIKFGDNLLSTLSKDEVEIILSALITQHDFVRLAKKNCKDLGDVNEYGYWHVRQAQNEDLYSKFDKTRELLCSESANFIEAERFAKAEQMFDDLFEVVAEIQDYADLIPEDIINIIKILRKHMEEDPEEPEVVIYEIPGMRD